MITAHAPFRKSASLLGCLAGGLLWLGNVSAQEDVAASANRPAWLITPSISATLTFTDNVRPGQTDKKSDLITSITPAIRIDGKGGRVSGNLNFSWQNNFYASENRYNNDQMSLSASGKAELVEQWLYLDALASIAQHATSVFGTQTANNELVNNNRSQTTSWQWSPYLQGYFGASNVAYELRYRDVRTTADSGLYATGNDVDTQIWTGRLSGDMPVALIGWSLLAEDQRTSFKVRDTKSSRLIGTLEYRFDPQLKFNLSAGRESDNYSNLQWQHRTVTGYGLDWAPTERTLLKLTKEKRSFGNGHTIDFSHRTALTAWKFIDTRSVVIPAQQFTTAPLSTAYDLLFLQLASSVPDPVVRSQVVSALLQSSGIPANSLIYGNVVTAQPFIQRRQQASLSLTGVNNTVTFTAQRSSNTRLGTGVGALDDFALTQNIRQSGFSGSWAHKLSPISNLTLNALTSHSRGDASGQDSRLRSISLLYTTKLGARTTASLGLRQNSYDNAGSGTADYTEHAITGTLSASF
ncbi:TIGR03016 family PEP-CTERM system-associated outer membrane protein [Sulfuricystis multivorans]|uniref:TIGR03016 family PEP-CTERM system-associated outer membrane protein n=1 Tax=Sulfuricystis multivorans TaxID=2211108 RepID=UPI0015596E12|nr:TIGR03016 family PEP-CTERM system-associated outer membrane protein [Sulfuricystis multivorans]